MEENKIALSKKSNRVCLDNIVVFSFSEGYHLWILLLVKFHIYFIVQFYFEFFFVVKKASYIRAYSKSILSQLSLFRNKKKVNLNSLPRMVDTNRCFYFDFKFCAEYFLYILCRIAFDFNYKRGTFFETHCMCIGYIVYQFRIMLLFISLFYRIVFYQSIPPYWKKIFKRILQKLKLTKETKEINSGHLFLKDSFLRLYDL